MTNLNCEIRSARNSKHHFSLHGPTSTLSIWEMSPTERMMRGGYKHTVNPGTVTDVADDERKLVQE